MSPEKETDNQTPSTQPIDQLSTRPDTQPDAPSRLKRIGKVLLNPYLLGVIILLLVGGGITYYAYQAQQDTIDIDSTDFESSMIDESDFEQLAADQAEIDSTNRTLNVTANSIFNGTMLVRSSLDVQGQLRVGQELSLNDLTVAGQGTVNNMDIANDLNVQGNAEFSGSATMQSDLTVSGSLVTSGSGTFAGNLTANSIDAGSLSFSGDLQMSGRIITGGAQTSASTGGAVGSGGTVSVSGNDTAGTINVNTGGGPGSGTLVSIQFGEGYTQTPRVNITPVGPGAGSLNWYITRNTNSFTIGTTSTPPSGSNFSFDYFVVE